ncbi:zinc finger protein 696-like [Heliangelus exortis]|uniref:zinc finger protein 696-like n=1 Tax=Heliangelus exortis TaxID=472823 RepID=UPI003A8E5269
MVDNYDLVASLAAQGGTVTTDSSEDNNGGHWLWSACPPMDSEDPPEAVGEGDLLTWGCYGQSFGDRAKLSTHRTPPQHPSPPPYPCGTCGRTFWHRQNLLAHKKHRGQHRHLCPDCTRTFCLRGDLLRHRAGRACGHGGGRGGGQGGSRGGGQGGYSCLLCGRRFRHKCQLQAHAEEHIATTTTSPPPPPPHRCHRCHQIFEDAASLSHHCSSAHPGGPGEEEEEDRPFVCGLCGRSFCWQESLVIHRRVVHTRGTPTHRPAAHWNRTRTRGQGDKGTAGVGDVPPVGKG